MLNLRKPLHQSTTTSYFVLARITLHWNTCMLQQSLCDIIASQQKRSYPFSPPPPPKKRNLPTIAIKGKTVTGKRKNNTAFILHFNSYIIIFNEAISLNFCSFHYTKNIQYYYANKEPVFEWNQVLTSIYIGCLEFLFVQPAQLVVL